MSANNSIHINARVPHADHKFTFNYKANEAEPSKDYLIFKCFAKRNYKPADAQYYPEDPFIVKAFGQKARYMATICGQNTVVSITGSMQRDEDWTDDKGNVHTNNWVLYAEDISKLYDIPNKNASGNKTTQAAPAAPAARPAAGSNPFGAIRSSIPRG